MDNVRNELDFSQAMASKYVDYAMSVITGRALPDVRDGLKPVHRRILYVGIINNYSHHGPFKKSARIVGDVMGSYHPHGDTSIYDAMVRMAQDWRQGVVMMDGQGNFGSVDDDPAAAMRYTESRLSGYSQAVFNKTDLNDGWTDWQSNYDNTVKEPTILPTRVPNILINGGKGIAVGMASSIPPFNLREVCQGTINLIRNPNTNLDNIINGPDFPTGGVMARSDLKQIMESGRGNIHYRCNYHIDGNNIIITQIPFESIKTRLLEQILKVREQLPAIISAKDFSAGQDIKIVIKLAKDSSPRVIANNLVKLKILTGSFALNINVLNERGIPTVMSVKDVILAWIKHRRQMVSQRTLYRINTAKARLNVQCGLACVAQNHDIVLKTIRNAEDKETAIKELREIAFVPKQQFAQFLRKIDYNDDEFHLSEIQADIIVNMRLHSLTRVGLTSIIDRGNELLNYIDKQIELLSSQSNMDEIIISEIKEIAQKYGRDRRTKIVDGYPSLSDSQLVDDEPIIIAITKNNFIKRILLKNRRLQRRNGKGSNVIDTEDNDRIMTSVYGNNRDKLLIFTDNGKVYRLSAWEIAATPKGRNLVNYGINEQACAVVLENENG